MLEHFKDGVLRVCDEVCGMKRVGESKEIHVGDGGNIKEERCYKVMCRNSTEENKNRYENMMNIANMAV